MSDVANLLWPRPRHLETDLPPWRPRGEVSLRLEADGEVAETAAANVAEALGEWGAVTRRDGGSIGEEEGVWLRKVEEPALGEEGYRLSVGPAGVEVVAGTGAGLFRGGSTLVQWLALNRGRGGLPTLPGLEAEDRPDFRHRGVMLDVSRDKVPRLGTLFALVDLLAGWKINQLQLYTEHTFAYRGHEAVWKGASPLTPEDVRRLDAHCRARAVELVPNQNSFAHLHRWLRHEPYRHLAECPQGIVHPWSREPEPFGLCPSDPGSLELLAGLYDQLLPCFESRRFHVGFDEPIDLGLGRSAAACAERGKGRVYLDFLLQVRRLAAERGRTIQCWADTLLAQPELLLELPPDVTLVEWGYEADHPFAERLRPAAGREVYVGPGTSSWSSFAGRATNALANLAAAATAGREAHAAGYLIADWGDHGHLQPLAVSFAGLLAGAGFAWNVETAGGGAEEQKLRLARLLDAHAFGDGAGVTGRAAVELGETYRVAGGRNFNGSSLFHALIGADRPLEQGPAAGLERSGLEAALEHLAAAVAPLDGARPEGPGDGLAVDELRWAAAALGLACRLSLARLANGSERPVAALPAEEKEALAGDLGELIGGHRTLWLARNRPGGLDDSAARLERVRELLRAGPG